MSRLILTLTHFSPPPFEAEVQAIHATDMEQFLFNHTHSETCVLLGLRGCALGRRTEMDLLSSEVISVSW